MSFRGKMLSGAKEIRIDPRFLKMFVFLAIWWIVKCQNVDFCFCFLFLAPTVSVFSAFCLPFCLRLNARLSFVFCVFVFCLSSLFRAKLSPFRETYSLFWRFYAPSLFLVRRMRISFLLVFSLLYKWKDSICSYFFFCSSGLFFLLQFFEEVCFLLWPPEISVTLPLSHFSLFRVFLRGLCWHRIRTLFLSFFLSFFVVFSCSSPSKSQFSLPDYFPGFISIGW